LCLVGIRHPNPVQKCECVQQNQARTTVRRPASEALWPQGRRGSNPLFRTIHVMPLRVRAARARTRYQRQTNRSSRTLAGPPFSGRRACRGGRFTAPMRVQPD
jgi:hypothetical protein